jgi:hypothetical protein
MFSNDIDPQKTPIFSCNLCDYKSSNKKDYNRHTQTKKHKINDSQCLAMDFTQKSPYSCECGKKYVDNSGLWRHKNKSKCDFKGNDKGNDKDKDSSNNNCNNDSDSDSEYNMIKSKNNEDLITYLIKENAEFKQLLIEQNKQMIEMCKNAGNNNNTNSHNKSFNLQFFLNETCKDALNISDFVKSIKPSLEELESTGRLGYVEGVSNIILKNLTTLDTSRRPIHCTDIKREILYVKDNDEWIKEQDDKPVLTKAIKVIANENIKNISEWRKENPGCTDSDSRKNNMYLKIVSNAMSGSSSDESCKNINKIIGNVSKNVVVDR